MVLAATVLNGCQTSEMAVKKNKGRGCSSHNRRQRPEQIECPKKKKGDVLLHRGRSSKIWKWIRTEEKWHGYHFMKYFIQVI